MHEIAGRVPMLIDGQWREAETYRPIRAPYDGALLAEAPEASARDLDDALGAAVRAKSEVAHTPAYERAALLRRIAGVIRTRADRVGHVMMREIGKPIRDARIEVARCDTLLEMSAEEAVRIEGAQVPLDAAPSGAGKLAVTWRFPVGVVAGITPFNAPFNLAWHKVAPALAAGNAVVLKVAPQASLVGYELARILEEAKVPAGWVNVLHGHAVGPQLVADPRVDFISFTGSSRAGAAIKAACGLRRVALELGGTGPNIVHHDADLDRATSLCATNSMRLAGQSCLSVQNIYVHEDVFDRFEERLLANVAALRVGDPADERTDIGTLVDEDAARRVERWIAEAAAGGARVLAGGSRHGAQVIPTVLAGCDPDSRIVREEVFGPVAILHRYHELDAVFDAVNAGPFGLHCAIFSRDIGIAFRAIRALRFGGVVVNGSSTWRTDQMPYGGIKDSGIGREGPRYAIRDMTDERLVIFNE